MAGIFFGKEFFEGFMCCQDAQTRCGGIFAHLMKILAVVQIFDQEVSCFFTHCFGRFCGESAKSDLLKVLTALNLILIFGEEWG